MIPDHISMSEQAPGSEFHPRNESEQVDCDFWDLLGAKKVKYQNIGSCGSFELLVSNKAHQMKEKLMI